MRLHMLYEGHWVIPPIQYPNSLAKPSKGRMSFLLHPPDRERFFTKARKKKRLPSKKRD